MLGLLAAAISLVVPACTDAAISMGDGGRGRYSVAFLRAVPGTPTTEPAIVEELRQAGFMPGQNLEIIAGDAEIAYPDPDEARRAVEEWVDQDVDVIFALSSSSAAIAREAAPDTNVLFVSNDPVATGLVQHPEQPEGRLTGVTFQVPADRTLDLAARAVPDLRTVGLVYPADDPAAEANRDVLKAAADELGLTLITRAFRDGTDLGSAVDQVAAAGAGALVISNSPAATRLVDETRAAAERNRLPVVSNTPLAEFAVVALTPDTGELGRQLGRQAARLLAGSPPSAVPVENPRRFVVILNATSALSLGFTLPEDVVREATEVLR